MLGSSERHFTHRETPDRIKSFAGLHLDVLIQSVGFVI